MRLLICKIPKLRENILFINMQQQGCTKRTSRQRRMYYSCSLYAWRTLSNKRSVPYADPNPFTTMCKHVSQFSTRAGSRPTSCHAWLNTCSLGDLKRMLLVTPSAWLRPGPPYCSIIPSIQKEEQYAIVTGSAAKKVI